MMKNPAEKYAEHLCRRTFLSLWTHPNPRGKGSQELCDILVVCEPDVLIISVKDIDYKDTGRPDVDLRRWQKRAVDSSVKQVFGAERRLGIVDAVTASDGSEGLRLPSAPGRQLHRIAVAIGGKNKVPLASGDYERNGDYSYVHVFDGASFGIVMQELDTITDFVNYLRAKEALEAKVLLEREEDLLALYLHGGRSFPDKDVICIDGGVWNSFKRHPQYLARKLEDKPSYAWDKIIETFCRDQMRGQLLGDSGLDDVEQALRTMAREDRFTRRGLGEAFTGFLVASRDGRVRARIHVAPGLATYVFLACPLGLPRKDRVDELKHRSLVARWLHPGKPQVVGIATEVPKLGQGFSLDLVSLQFSELTPEEERLAKHLHDKLGYFRDARYQERHEEEYPA